MHSAGIQSLIFRPFRFTDEGHDDEEQAIQTTAEFINICSRMRAFLQKHTISTDSLDAIEQQVTDSYMTTR